MTEAPPLPLPKGAGGATRTMVPREKMPQFFGNMVLVEHQLAFILDMLCNDIWRAEHLTDEVVTTNLLAVGGGTKRVANGVIIVSDAQDKK